MIAKGNKMEPYWLLFVGMTALSGVAYSAFLKLGGAMNPFLFVAILGGSCFAVQVAALATTSWGMGMPVVEGVNAISLSMAVLAGVSVAAYDLFLLLAFRSGSPVGSLLVSSVGSVAGFALIAFLFFREPVTMTKIAGIAMGIASLYLLQKSP